MSFGGPIVDNRGDIRPFPGRSMIAGLVANALGYDHAEFEKLERLQTRISHASRCDRRGEKIQDYQTVDLSQDFLQDDRAWTTRGELEQRAGASSDETHIRLRDYWADAIHTVALTLEAPDEESPTLDEVRRALQTPERPLFIGRKSCLPANSLYLEDWEAPSLKEALRSIPLPEELEKKADRDEEFNAWWPVDHDEELEEGFAKPVTDRRDWANQIHTGERWVARGPITLRTEAERHD